MKIRIINCLALVACIGGMLVGCGSKTNNSTSDNSSNGEVSLPKGDPKVVIDSKSPTFVECKKEIQLSAEAVNMRNPQIVWSIDDDLIATITEDGKLTGLRKGFVLAKATSVENPDIYEEIAIEVKKNTLITVEFSNTIDTIKVGNSATFRATVSNDDTNSGVGYQVNNTALASIDENGVLTAHQVGLEGKVIVTAYSKVNPDAFVDHTVNITASDSGATDDGTIEEKNGRKLIFKDDFSGDRLNTNNWEYMIGDGSPNVHWGNDEQQYYTDYAAKTVDGFLNITAKNEDIRRENLRNLDYTSARIRSIRKVSYTYGRIEARISCPQGQGLWPAFWMLPDNTGDPYGTWPNSGEIDIMEAKGRVQWSVDATLHYADASGGHVYNYGSYEFPGDSTIMDYHNYAVEWEEGEIRMYCDDVLYKTFNANENPWTIKNGTGEFPAPFNQKFHILLNMAVGGNFDGGRLPDLNQLPARMRVDYVKWYK